MFQHDLLVIPGHNIQPDHHPSARWTNSTDRHQPYIGLPLYYHFEISRLRTYFNTLCSCSTARIKAWYCLNGRVEQNVIVNLGQCWIHASTACNFLSLGCSFVVQVLSLHSRHTCIVLDNIPSLTPEHERSHSLCRLLGLRVFRIIRCSPEYPLTVSSASGSMSLVHMYHNLYNNPPVSIHKLGCVFPQEHVITR